MSQTPVKRWLPNDVARCPGHNCPLKETCLRFLADPPPDGSLVYHTCPPFNKAEGTCDAYISARTGNHHDDTNQPQ